MDDKIKIGLRYSLKDGIFASIMMGISDNFIAPYALAMKASAAMIGILASLPNLAGSLIQMKSAEIAEALGSRKTLINMTTFLHALMWLPIIAIPYLFRGNHVAYLVIFYMLFVCINMAGVPAWSSIMADYVPATERGKVFGWRNRLFGLINVSSMFGAGIILYLSKGLAPTEFSYLGFSMIFSIAFIARLFSWHFLTKMYEPPITIKDEDRFSFLDFLKRVGRTNFGRFVIFAACMNFSVYIASPFFAVYMLKDLRFNYLTYTVVTMAATLTILVMMNVWGGLADRVGNRKVLRICSLFIPFIPILWLFSHNVIYLVLIQIFSGLFWSGFNLSASNFIYDAVIPEKRTRCIAYFNVMNGFALFLGAAVGSSLLRVVSPIKGHGILTLFLISGILRALSAMLCSLIKEVREVREVSNLRLFYSLFRLRPII